MTKKLKEEHDIKLNDLKKQIQIYNTESKDQKSKTKKLEGEREDLLKRIAILEE